LQMSSSSESEDGSVDASGFSSPGTNILRILNL
jgi:hypothetical protein